MMISAKGGIEDVWDSSAKKKPATCKENGCLALFVCANGEQSLYKSNILVNMKCMFKICLILLLYY